jgi:hypothetical protein
MCPAVMLANNRIIKANGFVKIPINSIGTRIILTNEGIPGATNISFQYSLFPEMLTTKKILQQVLL